MSARFFIPKPAATGGTVKGTGSNADKDYPAYQTPDGRLLRWSASFPLPEVGERIDYELRVIGKTWEIMMERDGELATNSHKRKADSAGLEWQIVSDGSLDGDKHAAALQYFYENLTSQLTGLPPGAKLKDVVIWETDTAMARYHP